MSNLSKKVFTPRKDPTRLARIAAAEKAKEACTSLNMDELSVAMGGGGGQQTNPKPRHLKPQYCGGYSPARSR